MKLAASAALSWRVVRTTVQPGVAILRCISALTAVRDGALRVIGRARARPALLTALSRLRDMVRLSESALAPSRNFTTKRSVAPAGCICGVGSADTRAPEISDAIAPDMPIPPAIIAAAMARLTFLFLITFDSSTCFLKGGVTVATAG